MAGILLVAALSRVIGAAQVADRAPTRLLLHRPWHHPPLLDLLTLPVTEHRGLVPLCLSMAAVLLCGLLAREALGSKGAVVAMALAAVCPALVFSGSFWGHQAPVIACIALLALLLARLLTEPAPGSGGTALGTAGPVAAVTTLALLSDWPAWAPVIAWGGWLAVFRPAWIKVERARVALRGLGAGALLAGPVYGWMFVDIGDPGFALGARAMPIGIAAVESLLDAVAGLLLGEAAIHSLALRCGIALAVVCSVAVGGWRAARHGNRAWAGVLVAGTAGALVPALAIHPWLPIAAAKNLWYMSPLVLCLVLTALWPAKHGLVEDGPSVPGPALPA